MITRIVGDAVDVALLVGRLLKRCGGLKRCARTLATSLGTAVGPSVGKAVGPSVAWLWRAAPGDLLGRAVIALCGVRRAGTPVDVSPGGPALLVADSRLGLYLDNVPIRPYAQTLGRYVLSREPLPEATVRHELVHVRQWARLGPLFLPLYGAASLRAMLSGGDRYWDNAFEVAARRAEAGDAEHRTTLTSPDPFPRPAIPTEH